MIPGENPRAVRIEEYVRDVEDIGSITSSFEEVTRNLSACVVNPIVIGPPKNYLHLTPKEERSQETLDKYSQFYSYFANTMRSDRMVLTHRAKSLLKRLFAECIFAIHGDSDEPSRRLCANLQRAHITIHQKPTYDPSHLSFQYFEDLSAAGQRELADSCNLLEKREIAAVFELASKYPGNVALATRDRKQRSLIEKMIRHFKTPAQIVFYNHPFQQYKRFVI